MKVPLPVVLEAFGLRLGLRGLSQNHLSQLRQRFPLHWVFVRFKPGMVVDHWFGSPPSSAGGLLRGDSIESLGNRIQLYLCREARTRVLVHAGVVALNGKCVLLPGASGFGKSTLVHALVRAGAVYMSDEYAAIDGEGLIHPYARPLTLKSKMLRRLRRIDPGPFMTKRDPPPLPVSMILETRYAPGVRFRPEPLGRLEAIALLARNSAAPTHRPKAALTAFTLATAEARGFSGDRGGPQGVFRWLKSQVT